MHLLFDLQSNNPMIAFKGPYSFCSYRKMFGIWPCWRDWAGSKMAKRFERCKPAPKSLCFFAGKQYSDLHYKELFLGLNEK